MNPRALLAIGLIALVAVAGCSAFPDDANQSRSSPPELSEIVVDNDHDAAHTVDVLVTENESVVYWTTVELNGTHVEPDGTTVSPGERLELSALDGRGNYVVYARLDGESDGERFVAREHLDEECTGLAVKITENEKLTFWFSCG